jgi:hypothetical protein
MKKVLMAVFIVIVFGVIGTYQISVAQVEAKGDLELVSNKVSTGPTDAGSSQWNKAKEAKFILTGAGSVEGKSVELKAKSVYTKDDVFFLFEWPDKEKSINKNSWKRTGDTWVKQKADEDRLGVIFEISRIDKFATKGCAVLCHNESKDEKEWYYSTTTNKEKAEFWHWKAARSNPVGFTEDGFVRDNPSKKPEAARKRDAGKGKASNNRTKDKSGPAYMQDPSKPATFPGSLLTSEAVEIAANAIIEEGLWIPGYLLNTGWTGSFADIKTQGTWKNGKWIVMMSRKLITGNDDDVQFNKKKKYPFLMASFDNAHEHNSHNSEILMLNFK